MGIQNYNFGNNAQSAYFVTHEVTTEVPVFL